MPSRSTVAAAAALAAALLSSVHANANVANVANADAAVRWCATTDKVALTSCGDECGVGQACAQYPPKAKATCSTDARNKCSPSPEDETCTFQCLNLYNIQQGIWTLFVKEPVKADAFATDPTKSSSFPAAPIEIIDGVQVPAEATSVLLSGFDSLTVAKGTVKELKRDDSFFALAKQLTSLVLANINLAQLQTNFLPTSLDTLIMDNCALSDVPVDVGNMPNLRTLNISKNTIAELPTAESKVGKALGSLTSLSLRSNALTTFDLVLPAVTMLDLGDNKLTTFPKAIFNMTQLTSLRLDGNVIQATNFTATQFLFLKRLTETSTLGFTARACAAGEREDQVLGATVCVVDASSGTSTPTPAPTEKAGSSSSIVIIIAVVAGALLLVGGGAFIWHRRRAKANEFYQSVMDNNGNHQYQNNSGPNSNYTGGTTNNNSGTGQSRTGGFFSRSRAASGGRASSISGAGGGGGGRPSRANSNASGRPSMGANGGNGGRPSKLSIGGGTYTEIAKYQEDRQSGVLTNPTASGSRQRERAQIQQNVVRISSQDINYTRTIAKGAFGEVWLAHYGRDLVAVKKLLSSDPTSVGDFIAELNLLASLSHPRILSLVGACWDDKQLDLQIVMEFMDSGDLLTVLRRHAPTELTWENGKAAYCVQVCEAVFYLHSLQPALIHRDIKSRNILIDERKGAKLSDFGESRERTIQNTMTAGVGTARWVAPEIILGEDYSELADIYSLGVLLTELDTHKIPFEDLKLEEHMIVQQVSVGKLRPKVSDSCPDVIRRLVHECLQFDPQLRPSAARVLQTLMASPLARRLSTISDHE